MIKIEKVRAISSILASEIDKLYVTKLMKLFYYVDFISYAEKGCSVTDDVYYKLSYGPVPSFIKNEVDNLLSSQTADGFSSQLESVVSLKAEKIKDKTCYTVKALSDKIDVSCLSPYELRVVERVIHTFKKFTTKMLIDRTHKEKPYLLSNQNSQIDYSLAQTLDTSQIQ